MGPHETETIEHVSSRRIHHTSYTTMEKVYTPQKQLTAQIVNALTVQRHNIVTCVAPMQWGKTGTICKTIELMTNPALGDIDPTNVYVLTGISDNEWIRQTKKRLPKEYHSNVYHLSNMKNISCASMDNNLFIIDECHVASRKSQTISKILDTVFHMDIHHLRNNKIVLISATPTNIIMDLRENCIRNCIVHAPKVDSYTGVDTLLQQQRIIPIQYDYRSQRQMDIFFDTMKKYTTPKYHIFRFRELKHQPGIMEQKIQSYCHKYRFDHLCNTSEYCAGNMDSIMKTAPQRHTVILIKGRWRAAKTLNQDHIGVLVESGKDYNAVVQGLPGRMCGHNTSSDSVVFTNIKAVEEYMKLMDTKCDYSHGIEEWKTGNLRKTKRGGIHWNKSYLD